MTDRVHVGESSIGLALGDITTLEVDAIVNAANAQLAGGGGVDGAIHRAGGPTIMEETRRRYPQGCPTGSAVITAAGQLPARWVIHAVGPIWDGGGHGEEEHLRGAYRRCVELAAEAGAASLAFPAISAGVYGYPLDQAAAVAVSEVARSLSHFQMSLEITFCLFSDDVREAFVRALSELALP